MSFALEIIIMILIGIAGNCTFLLIFWLSRKIDDKKFEEKLLRQDQEKYKRDFEYMLLTVRHFILDKSPSMYRSTIRSINDVRIRAKGNAANLMDNLYTEIAVAAHNPADWKKIEAILNQLEKHFRQLQD